MLEFLLAGGKVTAWRLEKKSISVRPVVELLTLDSNNKVLMIYLLFTRFIV